MNAEDLPMVVFLHALHWLKGVWSTTRVRVYGIHVHQGLITIHSLLDFIIHSFSMKPNNIYYIVFIYQNEETPIFIYILFVDLHILHH